MKVFHHTIFITYPNYLTHKTILLAIHEIALCGYHYNYKSYYQILCA